MPKALHDKLAKQAKSKGLEGKRAAAYIYSVLNEYGGIKKARRGGSGAAKPGRGRK